MNLQEPIEKLQKMIKYEEQQEIQLRVYKAQIKEKVDKINSIISNPSFISRLTMTDYIPQDIKDTLLKEINSEDKEQDIKLKKEALIELERIFTERVDDKYEKYRNNTGSYF